MPGCTFGANAVQQHGVAFQVETFVFSYLVLAFFDFVVGKFDHFAAIGADQMVVMVAIVEFEYCLAAIELTAHENACLFELRKHAIDRSKANIDIFGDQGSIDVFRALMAQVRPAEYIKNLKAWKRSLQAHIFQFALVVHS